jgi:hypothetical protein
MRARVTPSLLVLALALPVAHVAPASPEQARGRSGQGEYGNVQYDARFVFARVRYGSGFRRGGGSWAHDYPRADRHMPHILSELTSIDANLDGSNVFDLDDPEIFKFPLLYVSEPGFWTLTDAEAENFRRYLQKGGFAIFDDFEEEQWHNFARQMARVLPENPPIEIGIDHPIFHSFFEMTKIDSPHPLVPVIPRYYGIFEGNDPAGRMIAIVNYNNDLAEYWEWSDTGMFPVTSTSEAYKLGVNYVVYAMTH